VRLGIFGGTFDPPHLGHLILAMEARHQLELEVILWVLTPCPPHKQDQGITPLVDRLDMLHLTLEGEASFILSQVDVSRPAPHYALDTVNILRDEYPGAELTYLMGGDSLRDLLTWHQPVEFVESCDWLGVMGRPGVQADLHTLEARIPGILGKVRFMETPQIGISASELRQRIRQGRPYRYYIPEPVYKLIRERQIYKE
jgi:nicotinate-nucleotide adenylyltransferase